MSTSDLPVFFSYARADRRRCAALLAALRPHGVVWRDEEDVVVFDSITQSVRDALRRCSVFVAFYSLAYAESRACQVELMAAMEAALGQGSAERRILVINPEGTASHIQPVELRDARFVSGRPVTEAASQVLRHAAGISGPLLAEVLPRPPSWYGWTPVGSARFVGRHAELWAIHSALRASQARMVVPSTGSIVQVVGIGGAGKSLVSEEYAIRFAGAWPGGVFWVRARAEDPTGSAPARHRQDALHAFLRAFGLEVGATEEHDRANLGAWLAGRGLPFLWVVDDLPDDLDREELGRWLAPHPLGATLITTRSRRYDGVGRSVHLEGLAAEPARALLARGQATASDSPLLDAIASELAYHPLALDVTGAWLREERADRVLAALRLPGAEAMEVASALVAMLPNGHEPGIVATLLRSMERLPPAAQEVLRISTICAQAPIPAGLLIETLSRLGVDHGRSGVDAVRDRSLASWSAEAETLDPHVLVRQIVRARDGVARLRDRLEGAVREVAAAAVHGAEEPSRYAQLAPWIPHAERLAQRATEVSGLELLLELGAWFGVGGEHARALAFERTAADVAADLADGARARRARLSLGITLTALDRFDEARAELQRAVAETDEAAGSDAPDALNARAALAACAYGQGDWREAAELLRVVETGHRRARGPNDLGRLTALGNLAGALAALGHHDEAVRALREAVARLRRKLGPEHAYTLSMLSNLAGRFRAAGQLGAAARRYRAVLRTRERLLGAEHVETLTTRFNLAVTLLEQGRLSSAIRMLDEVASSFGRAYGPAHHATLRALAQLANAIGEAGDFERAAAIEEEVVQRAQAVLPQDHPDVLHYQRNLAASWVELGRADEARRLLERVLHHLEARYGRDIEDSTGVLQTLATAHWKAGDLPAATRVAREAVERTVRTLGEQTSEAAERRFNLMFFLAEAGDVEGARAELHALCWLQEAPEARLSAHQREIAVYLAEWAVRLRDG